MRALVFAIGLSTLGLCTTKLRDAHACGGGVVTSEATPVTIDAQRALISLRKDGTTDIVVQLSVDAQGDFGVILPVPAEPTLDANPIDGAELDALDADTQVKFVSYDEGGSSSGGSGCACGGFEGASAGGSNTKDGVDVSSFVTAGPVTATAIAATDGEALTAWLSDEGFNISEADQAIVEQYIGLGRHFIVFKRSEAAAPGVTSLGFHFSMPGDARGYPLRISALGAAPSLAITTFIAAPNGVSPSAPFESLAIDDLTYTFTGNYANDYKLAVTRAIAEREGHAFVVEGEYQIPTPEQEQEEDNRELESGEEESRVKPSRMPELAALMDVGHRLTRVTAIISREQLDTDVTFDGPAFERANNEFELGVGSALRSRPKRVLPPGLFGMMLLLIPATVLFARQRRWRAAVPAAA